MKKQIERLNERLGWLRDRMADLSRLIDQMDEFGLDTTEAGNLWDEWDEEEDEILEKLECLTDNE